MHITNIIILILISASCEIRGEHTCDINASTCEFWLEVDFWLPMRKGFFQKLYVNEIDGKLYQYGDSTNSTFSPDDVILGDGSDYDRPLMVFNKSLPGPTLTVYKGQTVKVHVKNSMLGVQTSVHWHGIEMRGTPWMDGAAFVTQCPILPGQTFTYTFTAAKTGTYFYHGHNGGLQTYMGLHGPFIIKDRDEPSLKEHIMVIQDYNNKYTDEDVYANTMNGQIYEQGRAFEFLPKIDGSVQSQAYITSLLVNGRGRVYNQNGEALTYTPLNVFNVQSGQRVRFRAINAGLVIQHIVSIDNHTLTVVAMDGNEIEPFDTDYIILHSGERFDFIVETQESIENYWIRVESLHAAHVRLLAYAILRYETAPEVAPVTKSRDCTPLHPCVVVNCPFETFPGWQCRPTDSFKIPASIKDPVPTQKNRRFRDFFLNFGLMMFDGSMNAHVNGVKWQLPSVSALTQPKEVVTCSESDGCGPEKPCKCTQVLSVDFGDTVQLTLINNGFQARIHHPIHVHGYSFRVLKIGYRPTNASFAQMGENTDIDCHSPNRAESLCNTASWSDATWSGGNVPDVDLERAPYKDTLTVPAGGYAVIRFRADNPGLWAIHCHFELHQAMGMSLLLNDSFPHVPPPPKGFPECRSYPAPEWLGQLKEEVDSTTQAPSSSSGPCAEQIVTDDYTTAEFWGMFGALLAVILIQFIVSVICIVRKNRTTYKM